ncbi:MAG: RHS repeat-associated core domain-containing protein, partial [Opitutales bacterium]|nr:RHS repeat-associated core domain-containing protein [Opitutales bacterium]
SETAGQITVHHFDARGSTRALSDGAGSITGRVAYGTYGEIVDISGTVDTPFLYNGAYGVQTDASGLLHMRARYYSPELRRFINSDPIGFGGGMNWYAYTEGDPINRFDPFGLDWLNNLSNFSAGFGDAVTFGGTRYLRDRVFTDFYAGTVNYDAGLYTAGEWTGVAASTAAGGLAHTSKGAVRGARALTRPNPKLTGRVGRGVPAGVERLESSHFIASATLRKAEGVLGSRLTRFLDTTELNRRWLWSSEHYLADPARWIAKVDWAAVGPRLSGPSKWALRTPEWMLGLGYGFSGVTANQLLLDFK